MRVRDAEDAVYDGLRQLGWRPYLAAMWILCDQLRSLYAEEYAGDEGTLMASTLDLVREVVLSGQSRGQCGGSGELAGRAAALETAWTRLRDDHEDDTGVSTGLVYAWATFTGLVQEITGTAGPDRHDDAAEFVTQAVTERRPEPGPGQGGPVWINDPGELADDASPVARTLALFERVVAEIPAATAAGWDPVHLRAQILGDR